MKKLPVNLMSFTNKTPKMKDIPKVIRKGKSLLKVYSKKKPNAINKATQYKSILIIFLFKYIKIISNYQSGFVLNQLVQS